MASDWLCLESSPFKHLHEVQRTSITFQSKPHSALSGARYHIFSWGSWRRDIHVGWEGTGLFYQAGLLIDEEHHLPVLSVFSSLPATFPSRPTSREKHISSHQNVEIWSKSPIFSAQTNIGGHCCWLAFPIQWDLMPSLHTSRFTCFCLAILWFKYRDSDEKGSQCTRQDIAVHSCVQCMAVLGHDVSNGPYSDINYQRKMAMKRKR